MTDAAKSQDSSDKQINEFLDDAEHSTGEVSRKEQDQDADHKNKSNKE